MVGEGKEEEKENKEESVEQEREVTLHESTSNEEGIEGEEE
jgi:hypothetical protein